MDCEEYHRVAFTRSPQPLTFEASSGIFVGNAGGTGLPRFVVSLSTSWWASVSLWPVLLRAELSSFSAQISGLTIHVKSTWVRNKCGTWATACCAFESGTRACWQFYDRIGDEEPMTTRVCEQHFVLWDLINDKSYMIYIYGEVADPPSYCESESGWVENEQN